MSFGDDITVLRRILTLRAQRVDAAKREAAERAAEVAGCEAALRARDDRIAGHERALSDVAAWFTGGVAGAAQLVETALARRDALEDSRALDLEMRTNEADQLQAAREAHAEALRALVREQARLDVAEGQHQAARRGLAAAAEAREHAEFEDRTRPATGGRTAVGGYA